MGRDKVGTVHDMIAGNITVREISSLIVLYQLQEDCPKKAGRSGSRLGRPRNLPQQLSCRYLYYIMIVTELVRLF